MSTCRAKRIRKSPGHLLRIIFLDPFAVLFRAKAAETLCDAQRSIPALAATDSLVRCCSSWTTTFCVAAQIGSSQSQSEQSARGAVKATYEAYLRAWKDKDSNALDHLLSDDYQAVTFQGIVSTKAYEIATAKEDRVYNILSADLISVALFGDCAIASGLIEAGWKDERENPHMSTFLFLAVLERHRADWKLVATQSTRFNPQAEPGKK